MSRLKLRAGFLGLLAMLLLGSFAAMSAQAQGPFFHHRNVGEKNNGVKWSQQLPPPWEAVEGEGPEATLKSVIASTPVTITAEKTEVKGIVYNNALQGQTKVQITYINPRLTQPTEAEGIKCIVKIGENNVVKLFGHQAWTWDGSLKQLKQQPQTEQKPDWIFTPQELQQGFQKLPTALVFTVIKLTNTTGSSCGLLVGAPAVTGTAAAQGEPANVEEWSTTEVQKALPNGTKQHIFNGQNNIGVETGLMLGTQVAKLEQEDKIKTIGVQGFAAQELAHFEN